MGAPWFQIRHLQESNGLVALSANFELYGEISDRMMSLVAALGHRQEIYSMNPSSISVECLVTSPSVRATSGPG